MSQLSSCYFCGSALDTSLSEYPVVPEELRSGETDDTTVVLCPTCRRKLGTVIEAVVDAAGEGVTTDGTADTDLTGEDDRPDDSGLLDGGTADRGAPSSAGSDPTPSEPSGTPAGDTASDDEEPTLTNLEYNKVMRLLQNRELPVDRAEIQEVATSAYQISPEEFDTVIQAAIQRDLIAERNGQFVDPS